QTGGEKREDVKKARLRAVAKATTTAAVKPGCCSSRGVCAACGPARAEGRSRIGIAPPPAGASYPHGREAPSPIRPGVAIGAANIQKFAGECSVAEPLPCWMTGGL